MKRRESEPDMARYDDGRNGSGRGEDPKSPNGRDRRKRPSGLTKNEKLVWDALTGSSEPKKAYEILDMLKEKGVRAPMTVYRALDGLESKGVIHKLDGLNAFVQCNHEGPHDVRAFLVCESCTNVIEVDIDSASVDVAPAVKREGFDMHTAHLEVRGICGDCASGPAAQ